MRRQTLTVQTTAAAEMAAVYPEPGDYRMEALTLLPEHRPADTQKDKAALELQMTVEAAEAASTADTAPTILMAVEAADRAMYQAWLDVLQLQEDIIAGMPLCRLEPGMVMDMPKCCYTGRRMIQTAIRN